MANIMEALLSKLVTAISRDDSVRAIGMSGGERPFPQPGEGDLDIFVYCTEIPGKDQRGEMLRTLREAKDVEIGKLESRHWGQGDRFSFAEVETWLLYFTIADARGELEGILDGHYPGRLDSYYYPIGRCAMWKGLRALYDPDGFLRSIRQRLDEYPPGLASAVIDHHLKALEDVEDLERAVQRRDVFFFHFALDLALDHFLQALFALNREYFPSRKRSEAYLRGFHVKPPECEGRLLQVVALGGTTESLEQAYEAWKGLIHDLRRSAMRR